MVSQLLTAITLPVSSVRLEAIAQRTVVTSRCTSTMDVLLGVLGNRIIEWPAPNSEVLMPLATRPPSIDRYVDDVHYIVERATSDPRLTLALLELHPEAGRHPHLASTSRETLQRGYRDDVAFHQSSALPGGAFEIALLHYAMDGLLLDHLIVSIGSKDTTGEAVVALVRRLVRSARKRSPSHAAAPPGVIVRQRNSVHCDSHHWEARAHVCVG